MKTINLVQNFEVNGHPDNGNIVKFDGKTIDVVDALAYIRDPGDEKVESIQMKGDSMNKSKRKSGRS
jgi:hypothetical protein